MTRSLAEELGFTNIGDALRDIRDRVANTDQERDRRSHAYWIDSLLDGTSAYAVVNLIRAAMIDPRNQAELVQLTRWCEHDPVFRRTLEELSCVYREPPTRTVSGGQDALDRFVEDVQLDDVMAAANLRFNAHGAVWIAPRVRDGELLVDVITPAAFTAVWPASDPSRVAAIVFDVPQRHKPEAEDPRYRIVARDATYIANNKWELLSAEPHELARLPGVLVLPAPPSATGYILPPRANHDLAQADAAGSFYALTALKETLTVKRQVAITGDVSGATLGQQQSSARELFLPEGVSAMVLDRGVDGQQFLALASAIGDTAAANRGVSPEVRRQAPVGSGWELQLRRMPLLERRRAQAKVFRRTEIELMGIVASVVKALDLADYRFDVSAFAIEFAPLTPPTDELTELQVFETRRRLGLTDTVEELARQRQLTDEQAAEDLAAHARRETARIGLLQDLSRMSASAATTVGDQTNRGAGPVNPGEKATIQ